MSFLRKDLRNVPQIGNRRLVRVLAVILIPALLAFQDEKQQLLDHIGELEQQISELELEIARLEQANRYFLKQTRPEAKKIRTRIVELGHYDKAVREMALEELKSLGVEAKGELRKALRYKEPEIRRRVFELLRKFRK